MRDGQADPLHQFGGKEVLKTEELDVSQPDAGEVLVSVRAASVNPVDFKIRSGKYPSVRSDRLPYTLGRDIAVASQHAIAAKPPEPQSKFRGVVSGFDWRPIECTVTINSKVPSGSRLEIVERRRPNYAAGGDRGRRGVDPGDDPT